nr:hypothetical protein [Treponema sp.]
MKRYEVTIEETVDETFSFEIPDDVDIYEYVREKYCNGKVVLEPGECQFRQMKIHDLSNNSWSDWQEF